MKKPRKQSTSSKELPPMKMLNSSDKLRTTTLVKLNPEENTLTPEEDL